MTSNRKLFKTIYALIDAHVEDAAIECDFDALAAQIDAIDAVTHRHQVFLESASSEIRGILSAPAEHRTAYCGGALSALEDLMDYRVPHQKQAA